MPRREPPPDSRIDADAHCDSACPGIVRPHVAHSDSGDSPCLLALAPRRHAERGTGEAPFHRSPERKRRRLRANAARLGSGFGSLESGARLAAYDFMPRVLQTERGSELNKQRAQLIEPIFGTTKHNRGFVRFHRRDRSAVRTERRLMATTHNLRRLHPHFTAGD